MPNLYFFKYFATFLFISLIIGLKSNAQNKGSFDIRIHQIEYIDAESEQLTYLDSESLVKELRLSRNYNHVYVELELEHNPDTQYSFKVTGGAGLGDWEKSTNEIHSVGLSRGEHQLYIRGERNGLTSNLQQFKIYISSPYYLKWWFISLIIVLVIGVFYMFLVLEAKLLKERKDRNLQVSNLEARAYRAQMNPHFIFNALNGI